MSGSGGNYQPIPGFTYPGEPRQPPVNPDYDDRYHEGPGHKHDQGESICIYLFMLVFDFFSK